MTSSEPKPTSPYLRWDGKEIVFVQRDRSIFVPRQLDGELHARTTLSKCRMRWTTSSGSSWRAFLFLPLLNCEWRPSRHFLHPLSRIFPSTCGRTMRYKVRKTALILLHDRVAVFTELFEPTTRPDDVIQYFERHPKLLRHPFFRSMYATRLYWRAQGLLNDLRLDLAREDLQKMAAHVCCLPLAIGYQRLRCAELLYRSVVLVKPEDIVLPDATVAAVAAVKDVYDSVQRFNVLLDFDPFILDDLMEVRAALHMSAGHLLRQRQPLPYCSMCLRPSAGITKACAEHLQRGAKAKAEHPRDPKPDASQQESASLASSDGELFWCRCRCSQPLFSPSADLAVRSATEGKGDSKGDSKGDAKGDAKSAADSADQEDQAPAASVLLQGSHIVSKCKLKLVTGKQGLEAAGIRLYWCGIQPLTSCCSWLDSWFCSF
jgi:hypothetical protein